MITQPTKTVLFRMNGVANAFMRELGCKNCPQCSPQKPRANTSASLIIKSDWARHRQTEYHLLFDCGHGVVDSLIDFGVDYVTHVFLSHNHSDHTMGLGRLNATQRRSGGQTLSALYATQGTWDAGPSNIWPWLEEYLQVVRAEQPLELDLGVGLRVTPIAVYHGQFAPQPVIWVVEFGSAADNSYHKLVLGWDMLHLIPRYAAEDADAHYNGEISPHAALIPQHAALLANADELFLEANTLTPQPQTGHTSVQAALRFHIPAMQPRRAWFVHYSGHEDPQGPLSDDGLDSWIATHQANYGLGATPIALARHGMTLAFVV